MQISDAEWDVMRVIWDKEPRLAAEVIAELGETHDWNHRTIRTLLARLVEKGVLDYEAQGSKYSYFAVVPESECVRQRSESFLSTVFGGDVSALVAHFVSDPGLTKQEIAELSELLNQRGNKTTKKGRKS